ncbi:MAG: efflux RND transporter periplasmic adaptor subunit [Elusimicrobiota bacterium]
MMNRSPLLTLVCASAGLLAACGRAKEAERPADAKDAVASPSHAADEFALPNGAVPGLDWKTVEMVEVPGALETAGLVNYDPRRVATIVSRVQGRIEDVKVSLWDGVAQGDPIVQLYSPDFMTAEAEFLQAGTATNRSTATSPGLLEGMDAALVNAARQKLTLLGMSPQDLKDLSTPQPTIWIRAPIGGTVLDTKVVRGSAINPGDVLFTLGTLDEVWITADIYEENAARLAVGQSLEARVPAFPGQTFRGVISNISPDINPDTHTLQVRSKVANADGRLKPRMLASVTILTRPGKALAVPQDALVFDTDGYYAFVWKPAGRVSRRKVDIVSWSGSGPVRVRAGLKAGERIAASETVQLNALWHRAQGEGS